MEQITITLDRQALEQLPPAVLVGLLMGQQPTPTPEPEPEATVSLFPALVEPTGPKPRYVNRKWTRKDDLALIYGHTKGHMSYAQLAEQLGRNVNGVRMRIYNLQKLGRL